MKQWCKLAKKLLVLLCMLCLLAGCNKTEDTGEDTRQEQNVPQNGENDKTQEEDAQGEDAQGGDVSQGGTQPGTQEDYTFETGSNDVLWTTSLGSRTYGREGSFYSEDNRVYFLDAATGEESIICDDVTCTHKSRDCSAYFDGICYTALEDDHLVMVTSHGGDALWDLSVYETDVNGSNRKKLGSFGIMQSVFQMIFTEDKIIASYWNSIDENLEPIEENRACIAVYDRKTNTSEVVWEKQALNAIASDIRYHNGVVYFSVFYFDVTMEEVAQYGERSDFVSDRKRFELYALDLTDRSVFVIHEGDWETFDICQDKIWFACEDGLWSYDIATGKKQRELDKNFTVMQCYVPDKLLLRDAKDYWIYYTYTPGGELIKNGTKSQVVTSVAYPEITWANNYNTPTGNGEVIYWNTAEFMSEGTAVPMQAVTPTKAPTPTSAPTKVPESTPVAEVTKAPVNTPVPGEVTVITWVMPDLVREEEIENRVRLVNAQLAKDGYNLALEIKTFPRLKYRNQVLSALESGEADIVSVGVDMADGSIGSAQDFIRAGYLEDLTEYLASEEGKTLWNWYCESEWKRTETDGRYYVLPQQESVLGSGYYAFHKAYVTEEMLKDFTGAPKELEELLESLELPADVYGVVGDYSPYDIATLCGVTIEDGVFYDLETGMAENPFENEAYYSQMKVLNTMYRNGQIKVFGGYDPVAQEQQAVKNGKFVVWVNYGQNVFYEEVKDSVITVPMKFSFVNALSTCHGINKASTQKEAALQLLTLLYTDAAYGNLLLFGEEGTDYYLEDGYVHKMDGTMRYNNSFSFAFGIYDLALPCGNDYVKTNRREFKNAHYTSEYCVASAVLGFQPDFTVFPDGVPEAAGVLQDNYSIWQEKDFDTAWQKAAKEFEAAGGEELVAELNKQVKEWMALYR